MNNYDEQTKSLADELGITVLQLQGKESFNPGKYIDWNKIPCGMDDSIEDRIDYIRRVIELYQTWNHNLCSLRDYIETFIDTDIVDECQCGVNVPTYNNKAW